CRHLLAEYLYLIGCLADMGIFTYRMSSLACDCCSEDSNMQISYAHQLQNGTRGFRYDILSTGVRRVLGALWAGWYESHGSLNNLRFFVEGRMAKPDDVRPLDAIAGTLLTANELTDVQDLRESFISVLSQALLDSPVLPLLSTLQRTLDILDIEGLSKLLPIYGIGSSDFVKVYQSDYHSWDHTVLNPGHLRHYLIAYLLSATFKDCSIIIRPKSSQSMNRLGKWEKSSGRQRRCIDGQRVSNQVHVCAVILSH
ncbi:hypothetical protein BDR07DRAFT_1419875, partial [Suillus spraguei]